MNTLFLSPDNVTFLLIILALGIIGLGALVLLLMGSAYALLLWYRNRDREYDSLNSTLLQVSLPRDNEIKIDAAEQLFNSLGSARKSGRLAFLKRQPHFSFEIVGTPGRGVKVALFNPNKER